MDRAAIEQWIVKNEWDMFQKVRGINGRAPCQDEQETFIIMRISQFESMPVDVITSYLNDLETAKSCGRNLVMEKYAYMMEKTDPEYFVSIKEVLPRVTSWTRTLAAQITAQYMIWEKEVGLRYPNVRKHGRAASGMSLDGTTSMENYLCCELMTYSEMTLMLLLAHIKAEPERNLYLISMEKMARAYGYASLEEAEKVLS
ncbi:MAG: DUF4125 family protein [Clostridiales bacterium]|nr:DUF4125 family protein [Clostridiales bacterium]